MIKCSECGADTEVIKEEVIPGTDTTRRYLKCGHLQKQNFQTLHENVSITDRVSDTVTHVVSFKTEQDRVKGLYALINSNSGFNGIEKNKFVITEDQRKMLETKKIQYKFIK
jgi:uncharacterized Zn finger protein